MPWPRRRTSNARRTGPTRSPDCTISPCAGGEVPTARSLASALDDAPPGETLVVCQDDSMTCLNEAIDKAREDGYFIRPTDHQDFSETEATALLDINDGLVRSLRVRRDPACRDGGWQQRPRRGDARALRGADRPVEADGRPGVRPVQDAGGKRRPRRVEPRLPVPLPERRQPRGRDRPWAGHGCAAVAAEVEPARHPESGSVHPVQPPARGVGRQRRRRRGRGRRRRCRQRRPVRRRAQEARRHLRRPGRRVRAAQRHRASRARARHLRPGDRRVPARPVQDVLRRCIRRAHLRRGPRGHAELRGGRQRRRRPVPRLGR